MKRPIQIVSAPSILGFRPGGMEQLAESLLSAGLKEKLQAPYPTIHVKTFNDLYSVERDWQTHCLNPEAIHNFSLNLIDELSKQLNTGAFIIVMGGDCSILTGIMPALKMRQDTGLVFLDAHADFYEPEKSITGEVADMDLGIVTGRGPDILANIKDLRPYVTDEHVVHVGQRDAEEAAHYGSRDIKDTAITCFDISYIERNGISRTIEDVVACMAVMKLKSFWLHFDTDVLHDDENPAVDYRLPGGLRLNDTELLISGLLDTGVIAGMSVTCYNPSLDNNNIIGRKIADCIANAFNPDKNKPALSEPAH